MSKYDKRGEKTFKFNIVFSNSSEENKRKEYYVNIEFCDDLKDAKEKLQKRYEGQTFRIINWILLKKNFY